VRGRCLLGGGLSHHRADGMPANTGVVHSGSRRGRSVPSAATALGAATAVPTSPVAAAALATATAVPTSPIAAAALATAITSTAAEASTDASTAMRRQHNVYRRWLGLHQLGRV
jgi:hypothetical protein